MHGPCAENVNFIDTAAVPPGGSGAARISERLVGRASSQSRARRSHVSTRRDRRSKCRGVARGWRTRWFLDTDYIDFYQLVHG